MKEIIAKTIKDIDVEKDNRNLYENMISLKECTKGITPEQETFFTVLNDGKYLYFVFKVYDNDILPQREQYNSKIYNEEVVEVFISGANIKKYLEFEVSPNNTKFCALLKNTMNGRKHLKLLNRCIFISDVILKHYGYDAIIKASIKDICNKLNINHLNLCYFNVFRIDRPLRDKIELSALSPTFKNGFHFPEKFVKLIIN